MARASKRSSGSMGTSFAVAARTMKPIPAAYLITFTCYGTHLHGDPAGSVDRQHNIPGTPYLPPSEARRAARKSKMKEDPYVLDARRRPLVLESVKELCSRRRWDLKAVHVRSNHVHLVVSAEASPERILRDVKVQASRTLVESGLDVGSRRRWTLHGSTRYLWKPEHIGRAVHYVGREQGEPMAAWEKSEPRP